MAEQRPFKPTVGGSSPPGCTRTCGLAAGRLILSQVARVRVPAGPPSVHGLAV